MGIYKEFVSQDSDFKAILIYDELGFCKVHLISGMCGQI